MEFSAESSADHLIQYPEELYQRILHQVGGRKRAWDVATGHGKVAYRLAQDFEEVIATDGNLRILEGTIPNPKISFEVGQEDTISAKSGSVDLVTVGQALHMLNLEDFYSEVRRVVRPGGVLAVWGFGIPRLGMEFDRLLNRFYSETLSGYWPAGWVHLQQRYKNIPFPFKNVMDERVEAEYYWKFEDWMSFLESWTAVRQYTKDHGGSPVEVLRPLFSQLWGGHETKKVSFTFFVKKGLVI